MNCVLVAQRSFDEQNDILSKFDGRFSIPISHNLSLNLHCWEFANAEEMNEYE